MYNFSKDELVECSNETYEKLKVFLPNCKKEVALNMGKDDWGVRFISYGNEDEMTELINMILTWKNLYDSALPCKHDWDEGESGLSGNRLFKCKKCGKEEMDD